MGTDDIEDPVSPGECEVGPQQRWAPPLLVPAVRHAASCDGQQEPPVLYHAPPVITADGLVKRFGSRLALDDLTFAVPEGEVFGFVGANGAGKTTTIRILSTLLAFDEGDASVGGVSVRDDPQAVRALIGYVPDFFGLYARLTALEYLEFYAGVHGLAPRRRRQVAGELLELVGLADRGHDDVDGLSRGQKQRLCLARALVHDPAVLLLDEPASGLDPGAQVEVRELMKELRAMGKTILVSSHDLPELEETCSWVGLIAEGRMVAVGPMAEVRDQTVGGRRIRVELAGDRAHAEEAAQRVEAFPGVGAVDVGDEHLEIFVDSALIEHELLAHLVTNGIKVRAIGAVREDLAKVFFRLTSGSGP